MLRRPSRHDSDLFEAATLERQLENYEKILELAVADPGYFLKDFRHQLSVPFPRDRLSNGLR